MKWILTILLINNTEYRSSIILSCRFHVFFFFWGDQKLQFMAVEISNKWCVKRKCYTIKITIMCTRMALKSIADMNAPELPMHSAIWCSRYAVSRTSHNDRLAFNSSKDTINSDRYLQHLCESVYSVYTFDILYRHECWTFLSMLRSRSMR